MGLDWCRVACLACAPASWSLCLLLGFQGLERATTDHHGVILAPRQVLGSASFLVSTAPGVPKSPIPPMMLVHVFRVGRSRLLGWWRPSFHLALALLAVALQVCVLVPVLVLAVLLLTNPF